MLIPKDRDHARNMIKEQGITPFNVSEYQISVLMNCLRKAFKSAPNYSGSMRLKNRKVTKFLEMKTNQWERRECVSFNSDGFVGFAGWADDNNIKPILKAVGMWIEQLRKERPKA